MAKAPIHITGDQVPSEILKWSQDRPDWQRDALRRLVLNGALSTPDVDDLLLICKAAHALCEPGTVVPEPQPIASGHFPQSKTAAQTMVLREISGVQNVNALAPDQRLCFAATGMTVVYGDNGSGKSGYARVLKRACRARDRGDKIQPNIFQPPPTAAASALIRYEINGKTQNLTWRDDDKARPALPAVSFFDSGCASVHTSKANDLAFTPYGLDLFEKLVSACKELKTPLDKELKELAEARPASISTKQFPRKTKVSAFMAGLSSATDLASLDPLASLTEQELERLRDLRVTAAQDPTRLAAGVRSQKSRIQQLSDAVAGVEMPLSHQIIDQLHQAKEQAESAFKAAELAASTLFTTEPLPSVGTDVWKRLWESARNYSESAAYPNQQFPVTGDLARCVLCQQPLSEDAALRLQRFDSFVQQDTQTKAKKAQEEYQQRSTAFLGSRIKRAAFHSHLGDLNSLNEDLASTAVRGFFLRSWLRYRAVRKALETSDWDSVPKLPESPVTLLADVGTKLQERIGELDAAAKDEGRLKLLDELAELEDRAWLSSVRADVIADLKRRKRSDAVSAALRDVDTTAISTKSGFLTDAVVTASLRDRFAEEVNALEIKSVRVELVAAQSREGAKRYQIRLLAKPNAEVLKIFSEGEHRCIALAAFLSELATSSHSSALVFDDPVSSLDHLHREAVASRLAKEAQKRQVIVFTHDLVFLHELSRACKPAPSYQGISRTDTYAGWCEPDIPLRVKDTFLSVEYLARQAGQIAGLYTNGKVQDYEEKAGRLYGTLRVTWELAVAELIEPVLRRFHRDVKTVNLPKLAVLTVDDCRIVNEQRGKCSRYQHNGAEASNQPPPPPDELIQDIETLKTWFGEIKKRQDSIRTDQPTPQTASRI